MMFSEDEEDNDKFWDNLQTITSFDDTDGQTAGTIRNGPQHPTTRFHLTDTIPKASTPVSLLVESLVQQLCMMIETDPVQSSQLYTAICEQLYQMNLIDETYAMGEFETMRNQYQKALYQLVSVAKGHDILPNLNVWPLTHNLDWSRYHRDFDELNFIAGGGYGKVYRAKNKLDGTEYAIKKITIKSETINQTLIHLSEVKTLASLDHTNIVTYKAAWLEPLLSNLADGEKSLNGIRHNENDSDTESFTEDYCGETADSTSRIDSSTDFIEFLPNEENLNSNIPVDEPPSSNMLKERIICTYKKRGISIEENQPHLKLKWATLYIQMTLCQQTLRDWLDQRNNYGNFDEFYKKCICDKKIFIHNNAICRGVEQNQKLSDSTIINNNEKYLNGAEENHPSHCNIVTDIFCQLLNGLKYIHSKEIIHHDIKPSNIFIGVMDGKMIIQLGDFGQACPLQSAHSGYGFGTPLYAAPEQLNGECNKKSDIYSLGIVLLELLVPFSTDMERAVTIKKLKNGHLPKNINSCFADLLKSLITHHKKRPDIDELIKLTNGMNLSKDNEILTLQRRLSERDEEIETLKLRIPDQHIHLKMEDELKSKDIEIMNLKMEIEKMKTNDVALKIKEEEIKRLKKELHNCREQKNK